MFSRFKTSAESEGISRSRLFSALAIWSRRGPARVGSPGESGGCHHYDGPLTALRKSQAGTKPPSIERLRRNHDTKGFQVGVMARVDEIAPDVFRISLYVKEYRSKETRNISHEAV
jgi:hypothetical protein